MTIVEAAHWAPSSYNSQPWRMLWARRDTPHWEKFLGLLVPFNQSWVKNAGALVYFVSNSLKQPPGQGKLIQSHAHSFDTGAAWQNFALQARLSARDVRGMIGFDLDRAFAELNVPTGYRVEAVAAIGRRGDKSILPEGLQAREVPNTRQPLDSVVFEGGFPS